jgi:hypothetical protein
MFTLRQLDSRFSVVMKRGMIEQSIVCLKNTSNYQMNRGNLGTKSFFGFLVQISWGFYDRNLVDPASSHMLVSKIKPCMSKYKHLYCETANGSLYQQ